MNLNRGEQKEMQKWFKVGKIVNTHGIKGEVRVISSTDFPEERYKKGSTLYIFKKSSNEPVEVTVQSSRQHKNFYLLTFEGHDTIESVESYKEGVLKISEEQMGSLDEGEYYYHEIIGCTVRTADGAEFGVVKEILSPGANDVWVISGKNGKEVLIPYIDDVVKEIDVDAKMISIDPMEGLLD